MERTRLLNEESPTAETTQELLQQRSFGPFARRLSVGFLALGAVVVGTVAYNNNNNRQSSSDAHRAHSTEKSSLAEQSAAATKTRTKITTAAAAEGGGGSGSGDATSFGSSLRTPASKAKFDELRETVKPAKSVAEAAKSGIELSDEYTVRLGRKISDGLLDNVHPYLAQVHKETTITPAADGAHTWKVDGELLNGGEAVEGPVTVTFDSVGKHTVEIVDLGESYTVTSLRVRRELRDLSKDDLMRYFGALSVIYTTPTADGKKLYGEHYRSGSWFVGEHLQGAADKTCDHWHDDAGIATHHIGFTWMFENTMVAVDRTTAVHYWDYTREASLYDQEDFFWENSNIFDDKWFGPVESQHQPEEMRGMHIVADGTFGFLPVEKTDVETTRVTNPYGLLRSPWNTNPAPYLMRHNSVLGFLGDKDATFPRCSSFHEYLLSTTVGEMFSAVDGVLHGPVHLMIGGHWGLNEKVVKFVNHPETPDGTKTVSPDNFLLLSKFLWRQGYIRVPKTCSADTPADECVASCPDDVIRGRSADKILEESGVKEIWNEANSNTVNLDDTALSAFDIDTATILDGLCRVGYAGELFTSAAPQDPIFWTMHGNSERFLNLARLMKTAGILDFSEDWTYEHRVIASDTGIVCDWEGVEGMELPTCTMETCPGHREDDVLPFKHLVEGQDKMYTNREIYDMVYPGSNELPYVYDSLLYWEGCEAHSIMPTPQKMRDLLDGLKVGGGGK